MADIPKHVLAAVAVGTAVSEIDPDSIGLSPNLKDQVERAGALHPQIVLRISAEPVIEFQTSNIPLISALTPITGAAPITLYFRALSDAGLWGAGWISMTATTGLIEPVGINGAKGTISKLRVRAHLASSDGDTNPVQVGTTSATPAAPSAFYTIGPLTVGSLLVGVQSFDFNFGYNILKDTEENGAPFPSKIYSDAQSAELSASCQQLALATAARLQVGTVADTVTMQWRICDAEAMPTTAGGYQIAGQKASVTIGQVQGRPAAVSLTARLVATSWDGTNYIQTSTIGS